jgi:tRNA(His) guanylyltransferase
MKDDLGDRMKGNYEDRTRHLLPRRTYTIIRLDGKAFHTYTKGLQKPFDKGLSDDMDSAIIAIMSQIQGAVFAYTQSDEISILVTDFALPTTSAWFDGNLQKVCSVSASLITGEFNRFRARRWRQQQIALQQQDFMSKHGMGEEAADNFDFDSLNYADKFDVAFFDSRVFTIPDRIEVMNYFIWRNQDCSRNSVSMVAYANFSHRELQGKSTPDKHEMLKAKGINWATDFTDGEKNGRLIVKEEFKLKPVMFPGTLQQDNAATYNASRSRWVAKGAWKFTEDKDKLLAMIPTYE